MNVRIQWLTEDIGLKALSVLVAAVLWYLVNFTGSSGVSFQVPIEFKNVPAKYEILWESSQTVTVWLSGQERVLRNLSPETVKARIDLAKAKAGESYYQLSSANLEAPANVTVDRLSPSVIRVLLEPIVTKELTIKPHLVGKPAPGFAVDQVEVNPRTAVAEGVRRFLAEDNEVATEKIDISGASSDITIPSKLQFNGNAYRLMPETVTVTIRVGPEIDEVPSPPRKRR